MTTIRTLLRAQLLVAACALPGFAWAAPDSRTAAEEDRIVRRLESDRCSVAKDEGAGGGVTGARKLTLRFDDGEEIVVKWKPAPAGMDGWNNSPRKELAAYALQRLFLDPPDHVVPTTVLRCLPLDAFAKARAIPKPNISGARCLLGELEAWVDDVHIPDEIYDATLFRENPSYARHMADMNLLTYLIAHQDGRSSNFLLGNDPANRRVFSIDNGISFGAPVYNFFVRNWHEIRVPALRKASVERVRALPDSAFDDLAVVVEMKQEEDGMLRATTRSPSRHPDEGTYLGGGSLQLGLSRDEIAELASRRSTLLDGIDTGKIPTF